MGLLIVVSHKQSPTYLQSQFQFDGWGWKKVENLDVRNIFLQGRILSVGGDALRNLGLNWTCHIRTRQKSLPTTASPRQHNCGLDSSSRLPHTVCPTLSYCTIGNTSRGEAGSWKIIMANENYWSFITDSRRRLDDVSLHDWIPTQQLYDITCWAHGCESHTLLSSWMEPRFLNAL